MRASATHSSPHKVTCLIVAAALILTPLFNYRFKTTQAFQPTRALTLALGGPFTTGHPHITEMAIMPLYNSFFGTQPNRNQKRTVENIIKWNAATDSGAEFYQSAPHADGENFHGAQERLKAFKREIIRLMQSSLSNSNILNAQHYLGRSLHTLQDFYSHSNWVEQHLSEPMNNLQPAGSLGDLNAVINNPDRGLITCENCERNFCHDCENKVRLTFLTSGYYGSDIDRPKPHAFKCSHGGIGDSSSDGLLSAGINKDTLNCNLSPHDQYHRRAWRYARNMTTEFVTEIKEAIGVTRMAALMGATTRLAFVVDTTGSMGFEIASVRQQILQIINTRVSLGLPTTYTLVPFNDPSIGTITTTSDPNIFINAVNALSANAGGDCPEPVNIALTRAFNEMDVGGDILLFTDATAKDSQLSLAVGSFARSSGIRLTSVFSGGFDDCGFFDAGLSSISFDSGGQYWTLGPSEVGLISHLGHFLAIPDQVDLFATLGFRSVEDQTFPVVVDSFMPRMILSVTGTGATNIVVRRPDNTIVQPTDPNVIRIAVSGGVLFSITSPMIGSWSVTINGTSGEALMNDRYGSGAVDPLQSIIGESLNDSESGPSSQLEIPFTNQPASVFQEPQPFSIRVAGESPISLNSFDFVELHDRPHDGHFPINGSPIAGRVTTVSAQIDAEGASTAVFQLRGLDGTVLQTVNLQELPWPGDDTFDGLPEPRISGLKDYAGDVTVPNTPFQVYLTGLDTNGNPYQRILPGIFRPQTVEIITPTIPNLHPGQNFTYQFDVKNSGPADTFVLSGSDDQNFITGISPTNFQLGTNQTKTVKVQLTVPANAVPFTLSTLQFVVQGNNAQNSARIGPITVNEVPALALGTFTMTPIGGNGDAFLDPGEGGTLNFQLINNGTNTASNIVAGLRSSTPGIVISQAFSEYPNIAPSASGTNASPFVFYVPPNMSCGQTISFSLLVTSEGNGSLSEGQYHISVQVGKPLSNTTHTQSYTGPAVGIPDDDPAGVNVPLTVSGATGTIDDLNFRIDGTSCTNAIGATTVGIDHTWVSDLVIKLRSPAGTEVTLINAVDGDGNNFCNTLLDDQSAGNSIQLVTSANAPFTGSFKPNQFLSAFRGENPNGVWTLNVSDHVGADIGSVRAFSLLFTNAQFSCSSPPADTTAPTCTQTDSRPGPPASADLTTQDTGTGLASIEVRAAENVNVVVPPFTPGTTTPIVVTGTLIDPNLGGSFRVKSVDVAGNASTCERTISVTPPQITFRTNRHGNYEIYTMNDDGSNQTRVTNTTVNHMGYLWAPNGQKIAVVPEQDGTNWWDILVMNPDGSNRLNLTLDVKFSLHFGWSADSSKIAFESDRDGPFALWTVNADGSSMTRLINTFGAERSPAWAPNGQKIAYLSYLNSVNNKPDIWLINPDGSSALNLTQTAATEGPPVWSPDGTKILFGRRSSTSVPFDIYVMNPDGTGVTFLATGGTVTDYRWSPDGTKIAFISTRDGNLEIYVMNANGSNQVRLTNHSALDIGPAWSANGQRIVFSTFRTGNWEVFIMNADGSNQVNLTNNPAIDDAGRWRP